MRDEKGYYYDSLGHHYAIGSSHAVGYQSIANGQYSHAEGAASMASAMNKLQQAASMAGVSIAQAAQSMNDMMKGLEPSIDTVQEVAKYVEEKQEEKISPYEFPKFDLKDYGVQDFDFDKEFEFKPFEPEEIERAYAPKGSTMTMKTRICLRYDTEENWRQQPDFIPMKGEVCCVETAYSDWGYNERKIVIGDGQSTLIGMLDNGHYLRC